MSEDSRGVSPVVGVMLLLAITVSVAGFAAVQIFEATDSNESPVAEITISHTDADDIPVFTGDNRVKVQIVRNDNVDQFSYDIRDSDGNIVVSETDINSTAGDITTFDASNQEFVTVYAQVNSKKYVQETYLVR